MFANEDNPNQDRYKAREYFALACGRGSMTGCYELGRMYLSGVGGPKDRSKARILFLKACESGEEKACKYTD
jgi:TPR repeat protein